LVDRLQRRYDARPSGSGTRLASIISWDGSTLTVNGRISVGTGRNLITNSECRVERRGLVVGDLEYCRRRDRSVSRLCRFLPWILNDGLSDWYLFYQQHADADRRF
jgi:hypothetical protein